VKCVGGVLWGCFVVAERGCSCSVWGDATPKGYGEGIFAPARCLETPPLFPVARRVLSGRSVSQRPPYRRGAEKGAEATRRDSIGPGLPSGIRLVARALASPGLGQAEHSYHHKLRSNDD